jgi:hypothetical protein
VGRVAVASVLLLLASSASAEVMVRVSGDRVDLRVTAAPLADVLDSLGRQTGMKVVYEGPPPRQTVTVTLEDRSHAQAVLDLLEGQGLNYAVVANASGTRVETLLIAGTAGAGTSPGASSAPAYRPVPRRPSFRPPPAASPDATDQGFDEPPFDEPDQEPVDDESGLDENVPEEAPENPIGVGTPPVVPPGAPAPAAPAAPANPQGPSLFPGGVPPSSASPFTPQPFAVQPIPPAPPVTPAATGEEEAPAESEPPQR